MSNDYELPPLDGHKECTGDLLWHALNYRGATHDQAQAAYEALQSHVREYALLAVQRERERAAKIAENYAPGVDEGRGAEIASVIRGDEQ
jgi:hypothetical protein